ncbi:MAG: bifunctional DNA-formamidopyrimidine glycosylase/DNA-(apurinic or apyrimidinic site) lyase [Kangiellaceae bacterium]|nr:bifunctional DNA-formamidopyrimidine glycosylase/DNA-(apurinic or apyrimidinic site) lyase [Kangiellaceae bacterium]
MPELPEVETTKNGISPYALGRTIIDIVVRESKLRWPVEPSLKQQLVGREISQISRRAKYLLLETDVGDLMIHLGMSGSLRVISTEPVKKHDHVDICLDNGKTIRFNDPRRFGSIILNKQGNHHQLLEKLGVEPLSDEFDSDYLYHYAHNRKVAIKTFIMNNHIVVGVGNIYAQESLFLAGINPKRLASNISQARIELLVSTIKQVLLDAIQAGGSSLKDFTGADGKPGYFQQTLNVYGRHNELCTRCEKKLKQITLGQRTTVYCVQCQT